MRPRVLLLIKCLGHGGAERLLVDMVRHRDAAHFDYEVAYILSEYDDLAGEVTSAGVPLHDLGARSNTDLSWTLRLRRLIGARHYDILHTHLPQAVAMGRLTAFTYPSSRRPALVSTEHSMWDKMAIALRIVNRATAVLDDRLVVVSEAARAALPAALRRRAQVVTHGIDLELVRTWRARRAELRPEVRAEVGVPADHLLLLTIANLRPEKGYDVLLQAAAYAKTQGLPVTFASVGRGPLRAELAASSRALGVDDRVRFLGARSDVLRLLAGADVFVLPSRQEGLPVALMEGAAMGLPLVVTDVGEMARLFSGETNALIVPSGSPADLAAAVTRVTGDAGLRARLGQRALATSERFDVRRAARAVEAIYDELLRTRS